MKTLPIRKAAAIVVAVTSVLVLGGAFVDRAQAQDTQPVSSITGETPQGPSRIEVGLAFAQTIGASSFSSTQTFKEFVEDGTFRSTYKPGTAPGGGFDVQYNVNERLGVRLGLQTFSRKSTGTFEAQIPHPFFFGRPRSVTGSRSGLGFSETALSLTGVFRRNSGKWNLGLEGGPALFNVNATVAERVSYGQVFPYDTATFDGIVSSKRKASPLGFALGLEVGRVLTRSMSVVAQGRFTRGSGDLDVSGQKINVKAGGAQARVGLRFVLARKRTTTSPTP